MYYARLHLITLWPLHTKSDNVWFPVFIYGFQLLMASLQSSNILLCVLISNAFQVVLLTIREHSQPYNRKGKVSALYIWISTKCILHFIISVTEVMVSSTSAVNVCSNCLSVESYRVKNVQIKKAQIRFANSDYLDPNSSLTTRFWCWQNNNTGSKWILLSGKQANLTALDKPGRLLWYKHPYIT